MLTTFQKYVLATIAGSAVLLALAISARGPAFAASPAVTVVASGAAAIPPGVVTVGEATVMVKPDVAILSVGATAQAATAAAAQAQVAERIERMLAQARALGFADKDIATAGYSISPLYAYDDGKAPTITGYQATQMLTLRLRAIAEAGRALDALVQNDGATNASIAFTLEDPKAAQAEARRLAVEDARAKAEAMARTAGVSLGGAIAISDTTPVAIPYAEKRYDLAAPVPAPATQIPVGELDVVVHVQVQFAIR